MNKVLLVLLSIFVISFFVGCEVDQVLQSAGAETYVVNLIWGEKGEGDGQFSELHSLAADAAGNIYVCDTSNGRIQVFDADGNYTRQFGNNDEITDALVEIRSLQKPMGIAIAPNGDVWVSDNDPGPIKLTSGPAREASNRIVRFTATGSYVETHGTYGSFGSAPGLFNAPWGLTFNNLGILYVADCGNNRLQTYDAATGIWTTFGSAGTAPGEFTKPRDVAVDSAGNIYVADTENYRIQKFDSNWTFLSQYGNVGVPGEGIDAFNEPSAIDTDVSDNVFVLDTFNYRVVKFDQNLSYVCNFGDVEGEGAASSPGTMNRGYGLCVSNDGQVYVSDMIVQKITRYIKK